MQAMEVDIFYIWRRLLLIVITIYTVLRLGQTAVRWRGYLYAGTRTAEVMRHYLFVQVLRVKVQRFAGELVQIVVLTVLLLAITWAHRYV